MDLEVAHVRDRAIADSLVDRVRGRIRRLLDQRPSDGRLHVLPPEDEYGYIYCDRMRGGVWDEVEENIPLLSTLICRTYPAYCTGGFESGYAYTHVEVEV